MRCLTSRCPHAFGHVVYVKLCDRPQHISFSPAWNKDPLQGVRHLSLFHNNSCMACALSFWQATGQAALHDYNSAKIPLLRTPQHACYSFLKSMFMFNFKLWKCWVNVSTEKHDGSLMPIYEWKQFIFSVSNCYPVVDMYGMYIISQVRKKLIHMFCHLLCRLQ